MDDTGNYIWLFNRKEKGLFGAVLGSLLFHTLLIALLASTSIFRPIAGDTERLDVFWLYPYLFLGGEQKKVEQFSFVPGPATDPSVQQSIAGNVTAGAATAKKEIEETPAKDKTPAVPPTPPSTPPPREIAQPVVSIPPEEESEPVEEPEMKVPARIEEPQPAKPEEHRAEPPKKAAEEVSKQTVVPPVAKLEKPVKEPEKPSILPKEQEAKQLPAVSQQKSVPAKPPENVPAPLPTKTVQAQKIDTPTVTAAKTMPVDNRLIADKQTRTSVSAVTKPASTPPASSPGEGKPGVIASREPPTLPVSKPVTEKVPEKSKGEQTRQSSEVKGLFMPPVYGDLKLEINGKEGDLRRVKVTVMYRDFPVARRSRPLTKAEARRSQTIIPKLVRTDKNTLQAVIEIAREGIYDFRLDGENDKPVEAAFSVKLYEKSSKPRTKSLGSKSVAQKESILKILMPEGILWDDPTAFSGSMEDSDSVTRFNTDSGLVWKEYQ